MDRLSFFKQGLSSVMEAATSLIGLKKAADSFTEAVSEALSEVKSNIGLHLPTLDNEMYTCAETTLERVAELGVTSIEVSGYYQGKAYLLPPEELRALAKRFGIKISGAYLKQAPTLSSEERKTIGAEQAQVGQEVQKVQEGLQKQEGQDGQMGQQIQLEQRGQQMQQAENSSASEPRKDPDSEWWEKAIETYAALGCEYITLAYQPEGNSEKAIDEFVAYAQLIDSIATQKGMKLCFHPNVATLTPQDGVSAMDKIASHVDSKELLFEIDTYEARQAGIDAQELIRHYDKRIAQLHLHDEYNVGDGEEIDFDAIIKQADKHGIDNIYIEVHCFTQPPINCVEKSIQFMESLPSIKY